MGITADRDEPWGRRKAFFASGAIATLGSVIVVISGSVTSYIFGRILVGGGVGGLLVTAWVLMMETCGHSARVTGGACLLGGLGGGWIFMAMTEGFIFSFWRSLYSTIAVLQGTVLLLNLNLDPNPNPNPNPNCPFLKASSSFPPASCLRVYGGSILEGMLKTQSTREQL